MEIREQLPIGSIERLLISIYTLIPPVRADYFALQIIHDEDPVEPNYLQIRGGDMHTVLTDFKTAKTYHEIRNTLPTPLAQEIHASLQACPRQYLFVNAHGKPHTRNSFTLWTRRILTRILHTDFTLVFFRHAFATHYVTHHNPTDLEISEISKKMGHSSEMFRAYRWVTQKETHETSESEDD
jgi:integrase